MSFPIPGGNLLSGFGGYLQLWAWQKSSVSANSSLQIANYRVLDVAYWRRRGHNINPENWHSGCCGAIRRPSVAQDWSVDILVWWDKDNPPEFALNDGDTLAVKLVIGAEASWTGNWFSRIDGGRQQSSSDLINSQVDGMPANGYGILDQGDSFLPCYVAPQAKLALVDDMCSSLGGEEDGIVYQDIHIDGDSLLWYIASLYGRDLYAQYVQQLANQGFIATQ